MPETVTFDHYQVLTRDDGSLYELGRGAMGITYKAFDTNLRVPVALKVINTGTLNSEVARQRFVREARSAAKLRHRHVASVFHLGAGGDTYFYAMEFIDGETVEALIKRQGPLNPVLALRIALQVARALNAAQQHGLVHRDIKPSNLMLVKEDDELVVKVIDFGLAKTSHGEGEEDAASVSMGGFVGTPHFASPEQLEDGNIDVRSDIYSLGVTLWYMLAGRTPFTGSMAVVMSQHLTTLPPFEKLSGLPEPVETLLRKMLAKDPAERHQTASELRQDIESCLAGISGGTSPAVSMAATDYENYPTLLDDTQTRSAGGTFEIGAVIAERYEITRALGDSNTGRLFVARDRTGNRMVRLHVLRHEFTEDHALYTQLEREVERLSKIQHPNLSRVYGLETVTDGSFLVLEAIEGFSLMELLRARRELRMDEVQPLIDQIAKGVDYALTSGLRRLDLALHQVHVHFPAVENAGQFLREPVTQWPAFEVKISPLGITRELAASETWAGGETLVAGTAHAGKVGAADTRSTYIKAFATLTYELLGGTLLPIGAPGIAAGRYSPLAPLTENGNDIVRQGLQRGDFPAAVNFAEALRISEASEARRREPISSNRTVPSPLAPSHNEGLPYSSNKKPPFPFGFIGGVLTMLALGTVFYFFVRGEGDVPEDPAPTPRTAEVVTEPAATPTPTPAPAEPKPVAPPSRQDLLKAAAAGAEALEAGADWKRAINAWLRVAKEYPESEIGRVRLEMLLQRLLDREEDLNEAELGQLRDSITEAAQLDVLSAMMLLGKSLRTREPVTAFNWYSAAAAKGNATALTQLGLMLSNGAGIDKPDLEKALICFQLAADKNDAAAKTALAECYLYGKGVEKNEERAIQLLQEASDQGNERAMNRLGTCYHQGICVERDYAEALRLFSKAAERGYGGAVGNLGVLYMNGDGVPPNPRRAVELFEKGAKLEDAYSMVQYARCLESGTGIARNTLQAQTWYRKAAELGYPIAIEWCRKNNVPFEIKPQ